MFCATSDLNGYGVADGAFVGKRGSYSREGDLADRKVLMMFQKIFTFMIQKTLAS